jgi:hypothetical protein
MARSHEVLRLCGSGLVRQVRLRNEGLVCNHAGNRPSPSFTAIGTARKKHAGAGQRPELAPEDYFVNPRQADFLKNLMPGGRLGGGLPETKTRR